MRTSSKAASPTNPYGKPSVIGLDAGMKKARRAQRRRRRQDRLLIGFLACAALAAVSTAAWSGYRFYHENQEQERVERERRQAEMEQPGSIDEIIDEIEEQPRWNGPGNPTFGVGEAESDPEIVVTPPVTFP